MNQPQTITAVPNGTLRIPLVLALAAPLAVIVGIGQLQSVWWTFAMYQVGICLVAPAIESWLAGRSWREHSALLGLLGPSDTSGSVNHDGSTRRIGLGIVLGLATAAVTGTFLVLTHDRYLDPQTVILPAVLYSSYHAATIGHLVGNIIGVVLMTGGVLGAGLIWGWLRRSTGSVWPPLLSHGGAVLAYLAVHFWLVG